MTTSPFVPFVLTFRSIVSKGNAYLAADDVIEMLNKARDIQVDPEVVSSFGELISIVTKAKVTTLINDAATA